MIDWVHQYGKSWGACTRWMLKDTNEGYPSRDSIQKAYEGGHSGDARQHFPEVRIGESLAVARALAARPYMAESLWATLVATYVVNTPVKSRASVLSRYLGYEISVTEYWRNLDRAHVFLSARIESPQVLAQKIA